MTGFTGLIGVLLSLGSVTPQGTAPATQSLIIATPTFTAKGTTFGARTLISVTIGKPHVMFATAGPILCASSSAMPTVPDYAGYGWRIEATPRALMDDGVLVVDLVWQRRWQDGRPSDGAVTRTQARLAENGRVQLDYLGAAATSSCDAIGMALEIIRPARPAVGLFEAEAWLVPAVYGEQIQHQVVRIREGDAGKFYFDEIAADDGRSQDPRARSARAQIDGTLTLERHASGRFESILNIARRDTIAGETRPSGSSGSPLKAAFGETVEFRVPMGGFSLRVRVRQLR